MQIFSTQCNITFTLFCFVLFFRASFFPLPSSKIIKPIAIHVCLEAIKMSLYSKLLNFTHAHTHTWREKFLLPGNLAFSLDLLLTFLFKERRRMHWSYKLHMLCWNQQSNRAVCQGSKRFPRCSLSPEGKIRKNIQAYSTWGSLLHSKDINFALQVVAEGQWIRERNFIRNKDIFPVLHFSKHTSVVTELFSVQRWFIPKSIFSS